MTKRGQRRPTQQRERVADDDGGEAIVSPRSRLSPLASGTHGSLCDSQMSGVGGNRSGRRSVATDKSIVARSFVVVNASCVPQTPQKNLRPWLLERKTRGFRPVHRNSSHLTLSHVMYVPPDDLRHAGQ